MVETDMHRIEGTLTLTTEGYRSRLSDYLNARDRDFFVLRDASVVPLEGQSGARRLLPTVMIGKRHIRLVSPEAAE